MDIFDNIDLNKIINSEDAIIDPAKMEKVEVTPPATPTVPEKKDTEKKEEKAMPAPKYDFENLTDEEIAALDPTNKDNEEEVNEDGSPKKTAPASKDKVISSSENTPLSSLTSVLKEAGAFNNLDETEIADIKDVDTLVDLMHKNQELNSLAGMTEDQKQYLEALKSGVPQHVYSERKYNASVYSNIADEQIEAEENESLRIGLIQRKHLAAGLDEKDALKIAQMSVKTGEAIEDAKAAKAFLINYENKKLQKEIEDAKLQKDAKAKKDAEDLSNLKSKINEKKEIIEGITVNSVTKEKIFKSITSVAKVINNQPVNEFMANYLENEDFKIKAHLFYDLTKGFTDFSRIKQTEKSAAVRDLKNALDKTTNSGGVGSNNRQVQGSTTTGLLQALEVMDFKKK